MPNPTPTISHRLILTLCPFRLEPGPPDPCDEPCLGCRSLARGFAQELAAILDERYGGASNTAELLRGILEVPVDG